MDNNLEKEEVVLEETTLVPVQEKKNNEILQLVGVLFVICAVTAGILAGVNSITAPIIKARENGAVMEILEANFENATQVETVEVLATAGSVKEHNRALDSTGAHQGDVVIVGPSGYGGEIQIVVVLDINGAVKSTEVLASSETSGIGTKAYEESFTSQFVGKATTDGIDTISGATVTSSAYIKGVSDALDYIASLSKGGAR